ncbi:MAG: hypothetical protein IPM41_16085 [Sphingomonadales bacterium]|nr:hypothetical protein [Sphingomonadales bacterium]
MAQAVDEAGNIWEVDAQGNAVPVEQRGDELKNQLLQVQIQKAIDSALKADSANLPTGYR